jgi:hypothetical protein
MPGGRKSPGQARDHPPGGTRTDKAIEEQRNQDRHQAPQPPGAIGGPSDTKTPVAESGDQPGPQGPREAMQPGGQRDLPSGSDNADA